MKDSAGNLVQVTLFESYLSKYLIEHAHFFESIHQKILFKLQEIVSKNSDNVLFNRIMYNIFSLMRVDYNCTCIEDLKNNFDLFAVHYFLKLFCDFILTNKKLSNILFNLSSKCHQSTLFIADSKTKTISNLREPALFKTEHRGVFELNDSDPVSTHKLGITAIKYTPKDLGLYFKFSYEPSQFLYVPNRNSNVGKWFSKHNLPIISGTSGSAVDILSLITHLHVISNSEIQLSMISLASTLVAKGHHAFFEIMILLDKFGFQFKSTDNLFVFYEQILPKIIVASDSFLEFKHSPVGVKLLEDITDDLEYDDTFHKLPMVSIGCQEQLRVHI